MRISDWSSDVCSSDLAEAAQIEEEGQENPLLALIAVEELEAEASPGLGVHQLHVAHHPAGLLQHVEGRGEVLARPAAAVGLRREVGRGEDFFRHAPAVALQDLKLLALRPRSEEHTSELQS